MRVRSVIAAVGGLLLIGLLTGAASVAQAQSSHALGAVRGATAKFHSIAVAEKNGYALLTDIQGIACIDMPGMGGMGVHWANSALVGDKMIDATRPEAMVYAPQSDGTLKLAAVEYVVLQADWDATRHHPPTLFGNTFNLTPAPNRFGLPAFYSLHAWVWQHNPAGRFEMWNPNVTCPPEQASHTAHAAAG